MRFIL